MTEQELQAAIVEAAAWSGWRTYHAHDSRRSTAGFPDLVIVRGGVLLAWELKTATGRVTGAQQAWLDTLDDVPGVEARVVRPADLDEALARLTARTARR